MAGIITLALTPGTWIQGPNQAVSTYSVIPVGGLHISTDNGANYIKQTPDQGANVANNLGSKANLNLLYFRVFGGPITISICWT